jgi:murein DD-endopeptidase MepM/ murein hydrolase activator NlpD
MNVRKSARSARGYPILPMVPCMRRPFAILALTSAALAGTVGIAPAQAPATGGTAAAEPGAPAAQPAGPVTGGTSPTGVSSPSTSANGGNRYGRPFRIPPVIRRFSASPRSVVFGGAPTTVRFRVEAIGAAKKVRVRLTARRAGGGALRVNLGRRATNRTVSVRWARAGVAAGTYTLSLTVVDSRGKALARAARAGLTVRVRPRPKPAPAPSPAPSTGNGVFPVAGPHSYGDGFGVDRGDHIHQGQDIPAADGTPLVAPRASTVFATGYSASGSGEYVVLYDSGANRSYVYFHLHRGSTVVSDGQSVRAGQRIGAVGTTGHSTGPHLHFELWIGRWFDGGHAVDPLPTLRSWDG